MCWCVMEMADIFSSSPPDIKSILVALLCWEGFDDEDDGDEP